VRFPYTPPRAGVGPLDYLPFLPLRLVNGQTHVDERALLDTGATVNVMPYDLGVRLGLDWDTLHTMVPLAGNLARAPAKAVSVVGLVGNYPPVPLTFAWSQLPGAPLILGQFNFLFAFDACFYRSRAEFEVRPRP
jgi:aspartyl protease